MCLAKSRRGKDGKENNDKSQQKSVRCGQGEREVHDRNQPFWLPWQVKKLFVD